MTDSILPIVCPSCGTPVAAGETRCWLCRSKLGDESQNPYASPQPVGGEHSALQFSLASLFLITTLVAVILGAFLFSPGLGVFLMLISLPALARTFVATSRSKRVGRGLTPLQKIEAFVVSILICVAVWMASAIAFFSVCLGGGSLAAAMHAPEPFLVAVALGGGAIAAIGVATYLFRLTQPCR